MTTWNELTLTVNREAQEAVSDLLVELDSQGVMIEDSADYIGKEDLFGEIVPEVAQTEQVTITGYYPDTQELAVVIL